MSDVKEPTSPKAAAANVLPADGTLLTARGVRSREALLNAARTMFKTKGYANTTIVDITGEAGRAAGSFYTYFENKEQLLEQLAEDFKNEILTHMATINMASTEPYDLIRELCAVYWRGCRDHSAELAAMFQAAMQDQNFRRRWQEIRSDTRKKIAGAIVNVEKAGLLVAPNPNPEAMASAIVSMMNYFCYIWLIDGGEPDCPMLSDDVAIDTMARVFYRSVFAAAEPS